MELTTKEKQWLTLFKRVAKHVPARLEVIVTCGAISICQKGTMDAFHDSGSEWWNPNSEEEIDTFVSDIIPFSESM